MYVTCKVRCAECGDETEFNDFPMHFGKMVCYKCQAKQERIEEVMRNERVHSRETGD